MPELLGYQVVLHAPRRIKIANVCRQSCRVDF
jgi:hypothetical protein